ncbi:hypothetical protein QQ045_011998 [Rhodiola kirilowii]
MAEPTAPPHSAHPNQTPGKTRKTAEEMQRRGKRQTSHGRRRKNGKASGVFEFLLESVWREKIVIGKGDIEAAPVGLWDKFPTARTMQMMETMERMIEDPAAYAVSYMPPPPSAQNGSYSRGRTPWEIKEAKSEYKMRLGGREGLGGGKDACRASRKDSKEAEASRQQHAVESEEEEEEWLVKSFGRYKTRIALPENVQFEKIKAEVKDGVLYITVPKATVSAKFHENPWKIAPLTATSYPKKLEYSSTHMLSGGISESWANPMEFDPCRFLNTNVEVKDQDFRFLPFGGGRRGCPGYAFGLATVELALANLLYHFSWTLPKNVSIDAVDLDEIFGLATRKKNPLILVQLSTVSKYVVPTRLIYAYVKVYQVLQKHSKGNKKSLN